MRFNGYKIVQEAVDTEPIHSKVISIIQNRLGKEVDLDSSLVNEYGATPEDIANILIDIEEQLHVFLSQDIHEKELLTARGLVSNVLINLKDPHSRNRIVHQVASHIEKADC